ncbi:MAG TPA: hypothetical protein VH020_04090 [Stellaceae bacterium]|jgi:hypothetical protein|nr:hypothetical protein [Stellaceae bacterium]
MIVGRIIGCLFLVVAAIAFLRDGLNFYDTGHIALLSSDQLWSSLGPTSYESTKLYGDTSLPILWDPIITTILALPTFVVAGVLGLLFLLASRKPRPRRRRRPRPAGNKPA